jgi:hypothetical protein
MSDSARVRRSFQFRRRVLFAPLAFAVMAVIYFFIVPAIRERQAKDNVLEKLQTIDKALKRYEDQHPGADRQAEKASP